MKKSEQKKHNKSKQNNGNNKYEEKRENKNYANSFDVKVALTILAGFFAMLNEFIWLK